jgi:hypothetical protein
MALERIDRSIPPFVHAVIRGEQVKDVVHCAACGHVPGEDFEPAVLTDYRIAQYHFLRWLRHQQDPGLVLYAGSGHDIIPKLVLGRRRIVHTSLEDFYWITQTERDRRYFPDLRRGIKVIADNCRLPFRDSSFNTLLLFGQKPEVLIDQREELLRILAPGGLVVGSSDVYTPGNLQVPFGDLSQVEVPAVYQHVGTSRAEFFVYARI